jgi:NADPH-dependent curcumin reductase CurA
MRNSNRQWILKRRPVGDIKQGDLELVENPIPVPGPGQILVRTLFLSLDPTNRIWMSDMDQYMPPVQLGEVMRGGTLGVVEQSNNPNYKVGDVVNGLAGWQEYSIADAAQKMAKGPVPLPAYMSVLGMTGATAYFGLLDLGKPKPGETVVVSAAAGAVGSIVGQIAKLKGCRVVGIAGGAAKCALLQTELGFDAAVDYKAGDTRRALRAACPSGVDVYFDNVGGDVLEACLFNMNNHGRIACCGAVSQYDGAAPPHGPRGVPGLIVTKRLTLTGFVVMDFYAKREAALADLQAWVKSGELKVREDIMDGLESLPQALIGLLAGDNVGKRMVKVV